MPQRIGQSKVLGIAIGERSLVVAEAARAGESPRVTLAATYHYPLELSLDNPAAIGEGLADFLKEKGFTARQAVVGVPARWVLSKAKEVPPAEPAIIADALRLQVEGEFTQELRDLSFDYAGQISEHEAKQVLLVALQGKHTEQIKAIADAARLQLSAITPVGCVLGAATASLSGRPRQAMVVSVGPGGVELAALDGPGAPRVLRHLGASASSPAMLAGEFRRATFAGGLTDFGTNGNKNGVNGNGANGHGRNGPALVFWDAAVLSDASRRALADAAGARIEQGDLQTLGVPAGLNGGAADVAGAAALAIAALSDEPLPADFLHSKLSEPKRLGLPPKMMMLIGGGVIVLGLIIFVVASLWSLGNQADSLQSQLDSRKAEINSNKEFLKKLSFVESWHGRDTKFLSSIKDLVTLVQRFLDNQRDSTLLYVTEMTINEPSQSTSTSGNRPAGGMVLTLKGRAPSSNRYYQFINAFKGTNFRVQSPSFKKVGNTDQAEFGVQLVYTPNGKPAAAEAPPPIIEFTEPAGSPEPPPASPATLPGTQPATQPNGAAPMTQPVTPAGATPAGATPVLGTPTVPTPGTAPAGLVSPQATQPSSATQPAEPSSK